MKFGMYYFLQRPEGASEAEIIRTEVEQMVYAESLGYDTVWLTEHHFADYGLSASPSVLASAVLSRTTTLKVGLAVYVLPFHDPIRFAEEMATLDIIGSGRFIVGIGRGNRPTEFMGYRIPQKESRTRLEEAMEIAMQAWTKDEVHFEGRHWTIPGIPVHPKPDSRPHPPLAMAVTSEDSIRWAARHGLRMLSSGLHTPLSRNKESLRIYGEELQKHHSPDERRRLLDQWTVTKHVYVAPTDAEAQADARDAEMWFLDSMARSMSPAKWTNLDPEIRKQAESFIANLRSHKWEDLLAGPLVIGSPETVAGKARELKEAGVGEMVCWMNFGGISDAKTRRSMELFASHVMPALR
jgi:alkanesulfonate monooxygenase SsuD/methylene tetrahydromethanopterin reductase-like flavin-dependent oxidoreductase (luciferase family)